MKTAIIIPARYASVRLPGKPLLKQTGKYLIEHVYDQACKCPRVKDIVVATDDPRIKAAVLSFGGRVVMTRRDHPSGTDRVAEVAKTMNVDVVVNLQGDEPLVDPKAIETLIEVMRSHPESQAATLAVPIRNESAWRDPNCVKVVCDSEGRALYFSRAPIPFVRDGQPPFDWNPPQFLQHLGIYAYRRSFLLKLAASPPSPLERREKLEQLRILGMGQSLHVGLVAEAARGVDTLGDYEHFVRQYRQTKRAA